ncbi:MAG: SRPBCC family protein [Armatimonadota bacterium]
MAVHERSVTVNAPVHEVFMMWRNLENFPKFMTHVKEVEMTGPDTSHWKGEVSGVKEEWDAKTTKLEEDRVIGWDSVSGFENSGEVRFDPKDGGTKVTVRFEYNPPAGVLGDVAESVYLGGEFDKDLEEDLKHFKERAEAL